MTGRGMLDFYGALSGMDSALRKRRIVELLALVGLEQWGDVRVGKYSKGMLQRVGLAQALMRSEEHTSELQSRLHLACRLLLEKKTHAERVGLPGNLPDHRRLPGVQHTAPLIYMSIDY